MLTAIKQLVPPTMRQALRKSSRELTGPLRLMPDFLVIGAQKCGTTSLYHYLVSHPHIMSPSEKQMHFFDNNFSKGLSWYRTHFPSSLYRYYLKHIHKQGFITGEATPYYIFHPLAPQRIQKHLPNAKLILLLRNPVDRAYSHYNHEVRKGTETLSFTDALDREEERLAGEREKMLVQENYYSFNHQHYSYLARGVYIEQLEYWFNYFPKEQFLILKSEDFYTAPGATLKQILNFLHLPEWQLPKYENYNVGKYQKMDDHIKARLRAYFAPHNEKLYQLIGRDFGWER
ncbi:MAG: sulfotransferase [Acidobacteriota bacterium]